MALLKQLSYLGLFAFLGQLIHNLSFTLPLDSASKAIERDIEPLNNILTSIAVHHARSIDLSTNIRGRQPHVDENENPTCKQLLTTLADKATIAVQARRRVSELGRVVMIHGKSLASNTMSFANDWVKLDADARKARAANLLHQTNAYFASLRSLWGGYTWLLTSTALLFDENARVGEYCSSIRGYLEQLTLQPLSALDVRQMHRLVNGRQRRDDISRQTWGKVREQQDVLGMPRLALEWGGTVDEADVTMPTMFDGLFFGGVEILAMVTNCVLARPAIN